MTILIYCAEYKTRRNSGRSLLAKQAFHSTQTRHTLFRTSQKHKRTFSSCEVRAVSSPHAPRKHGKDGPIARRFPQSCHCPSPVRWCRPISLSPIPSIPPSLHSLLPIRAIDSTARRFICQCGCRDRISRRPALLSRRFWAGPSKITFLSAPFLFHPLARPPRSVSRQKRDFSSCNGP